MTQWEFSKLLWQHAFKVFLFSFEYSNVFTTTSRCDKENESLHKSHACSMQALDLPAWKVTVELSIFHMDFF